MLNNVWERDDSVVTLTGTRYNALDSYCRELQKKRRTKVFIAKPPNGAMGVG